jgi:catechol 2,3-dioxygenase-like lactoylglutathione lyase family enzyme
MSGGLDHVVHAVRDLEAAAHLYGRLGFTVGARNKHPWGTHNRIVQLPGFFVEVLTLAEPDQLGSDGFSTLFGAFNGAFLERGEGLSLLILESADARADADAFRAAGIAASDVMRFEREGRRPDGSLVKVAFSLAFAEDRQAPAIHFATCQQHHPENFWNPDLQHHANSAQAIAGVVMVGADPQAHGRFIESFSGLRARRDGADALSAVTPRGELTVMTPALFRATYGTEPPPTEQGARLAAMRFAVSDIAAAEDALATGEMAYAAGPDRIVVGPQPAMGATIVFEERAG